MKKIEWKIKPGDAFKCEQINEVVDAVNELIEKVDSDSRLCTCGSPTIHSEHMNAHWDDFLEKYQNKQWVKCEYQWEDRTGKVLGRSLEKCQGTLLPCEVGSTFVGFQSVPGRKYWKCSQCNREVK